MIKTILKSTFLSLKQTPQGKLVRLAAIYLAIISLILTFSPTVKTKLFAFDQLEWNHWIGYLVWLIMFALVYIIYEREQIKRDILLLPLVAIMSGWGLLVVWRISPSLGLKQSVWLFVGTGVLCLGLPFRKTILNNLRRYKYIWLVVGLALTTLTFFLGTNPTNSGPELWLGCCGIYLQPAEPLKLLLILFLAAYFADRQPFNSKLLPLITPTVLMAGLTILILIFQRDLGTASIFVFIYASMVYIATGKKELLLVSIIIIGLGFLIGYSLFDVIQLRVEAWINPWQDPSGRSYQIVQSLISISAGGMTGRGPGMGYPNFVPIAFSDFIFSSIAEEFGFPGTLGLIIILILFTFRGLTIAIQASDHYQRYLAAGLTVYIVSQSILIIGGNIRMLPLTGVTLPFFSYGGSSLLTSFLAVLLIIAINQNTTQRGTNASRPAPIIHLSAFLLVGLISLTLINGWWSFYRGPSLIQRTDNPRRVISDQYNQRGEIFDRDLVSLSSSTGSPGDYVRYYPYPEVSSIIGYTQPFYGQAGIEASFDSILRGIENQSPWTIWYYHLLYGQSPPGLDIKLTLDVELQVLAASFFKHTPGAVVLLDAKTGEVLVLFSSPFFDANQLDENWADLQLNQDAPLINRATQSQYPPGPGLAPFLIAESVSGGDLPDNVEALNSLVGSETYTCSSPVTLPTTWNIMGRMGCPAPLELLGEQLDADGIDELFSKLGFYQAQDISLDVSAPYVQTGITNPSITAIGQSDILVTPFQMALAAASLSNFGERPSPQLIAATQNGDGAWVPYPQSPQDPVQLFSQLTVEKTTEILKNPSLPIWESTAFAKSKTGQHLTWYLAGHLPEQESSYAVVVLLERQDAQLAKIIGQRLLSEVTAP